MKKTAILMALICIFAAPAISAAMEPISEAAMDAVTGRQGINVVIDDFRAYIHKTAGPWYQDGSGGDTAAAGISEMHGIIDVNAIMPAPDPASAPLGVGNTAVKGDYETATYDFSSFTASPVKIGVTSKVPALSAGAANNAGIAETLNLVATHIMGVMIELPTAEIYTPETMINLAMTTNPAADTSQSYGEVYTRATLATLGGHLEIVPGGRQDIYDMVLSTMSLTGN